MSWTDKIKIERLPEDYQLIARIVGVDLMVKLAYELHGVHLYLKHPDRLFQKDKDDHILENFDGRNHRQLALEVRCSERYIYDLVSASREKAKQGNLFHDESC